MKWLCVVATVAMGMSAAPGRAQSLGDIARQIRQQHTSEPAHVYTNQDIETLQSQPVWASGDAVARPAAPVRAPQPVTVKQEDVSCNFYFNAQSLLPKKTSLPALAALPAEDVARLAGTASIWEKNLQVSIHNDTPWELRQVTVRLMVSSVVASGDGIHSHSAARGTLTDPPGDVERVITLELPAEPYSAALAHEVLPPDLASGTAWSWQIVSARGVLPATAKVDAP